MKKIIITGRVRDMEVFVPEDSCILFEGMIDVKNITIVVANYFERCERGDTIVDDTNAIGSIDGINIRAADGDFERWKVSPLNPYRKTGLWSNTLQHGLKWSAS